MEAPELIRLKIQLLFSLYFNEYPDLEDRSNRYLEDIRLFKAFLDVPLKEFIPNQVLNQVRLYDDAPALFYLEKEKPLTNRRLLFRQGPRHLIFPRLGHHPWPAVGRSDLRQSSNNAGPAKIRCRWNLCQAPGLPL